MSRCLLLVAFAVLSLLPLQSQAHDLLPQQIQQYITEHPTATPEEIRAYIADNAELASQSQSSSDIIEVIKGEQKGFWENVWDFIKLGVEHILIGPDHILFVLSLLLVVLSWRDILKMTGTFTVAHSLTFIIAGSGFFTLSASIVEPLIALSIAYVAITTVFLKHKPFFASMKAKLGTVFFFGLFHGLGFAGLLQDLQIPQNKFISSLISFNVGIEFGQLIIIAICFPVLYLLRKKSWYPRMIQLIAAVIAAIGLFWCVQRIIGAFSV